MLNASHLTRRYGSFVAVDDASFSIGKGEVVGLLGHNGAGKTTIMKMLSGFLEPDTGSVEIDGLSLADHPKQAQRQLGYLPESLPIYPEMTLIDYLDYAASLKGLQGEWRWRDIKRALEATELEDKLSSPIGTLSRGYRQRVGVAQALLGSPKVLILDEPTNGLDPTQTQQMRQLLRELSREATILLSTHIMQEVEAVCERAMILRAGQLVLDKRLDELRDSHRLHLDTSASRQTLEQTCTRLFGTEKVRIEATPAQGPAHSYRLALGEDRDLNQTGAELARALMEAGEQLYRLQPETHNLESLFREVSQAPLNAAQTQKEDRNAA